MTRRTMVLTAALAVIVGAAASISALTRDTSPRPKKVETVTVKKAPAKEILRLVRPHFSNFGIKVTLHRRTVVLTGRGDLKRAAKLVRQMDIGTERFTRIFSTWTLSPYKDMKSMETYVEILFLVDEIRKHRGCPGKRMQDCIS